MLDPIFLDYEDSRGEQKLVLQHVLCPHELVASLCETGELSRMGVLGDPCLTSVYVTGISEIILVYPGLSQVLAGGEPYTVVQEPSRFVRFLSAAKFHLLDPK